jgi:predicted nucleotidyltransferase component of viral defense system
LEAYYKFGSGERFLIPKADIVAWRQVAPWVSDAQVEQDLITTRTLVVIFGDPFLSKELAFRGGTALHKLYFKSPLRYSDDIDLVQIKSGPIGKILDTIQTAVNPFLGEPRRKQTEETVTLTYRMESEGPPVVPLRLKIEINTREHFSVLGFRKVLFEVDSRWYSGNCEITTFSLEELLSTKVRALYQRRKGRDLFDLWLGLTEGKADPEKIVEIFKYYMKSEGNFIDRKRYENNIEEKMRHPGFIRDLTPLLSPGIDYDSKLAYSLILKEIVARMDEV